MKSNLNLPDISEVYLELIQALSTDDFTNIGDIAEVSWCHYEYFFSYLGHYPRELWYPSFVNYMEGVALSRNEKFFSYIAHFRSLEFLQMMLGVESRMTNFFQ